VVLQTVLVTLVVFTFDIFLFVFGTFVGFAVVFVVVAIVAVMEVAVVIFLVIIVVVVDYIVVVFGVSASFSIVIGIGTFCVDDGDVCRCGRVVDCTWKCAGQEREMIQVSVIPLSHLVIVGE